MKAIVTVKHLDRAIEIRKSGIRPYRLSRECLIGQVCQEIYGREFVGCAENCLSLKSFGEEIPITDEVVTELIMDFDAGSYDIVRAKLPVKVILPNVPRKLERGEYAIKRQVAAEN